MKNLFLAGAFLLTSLCCFAQNTSETLTENRDTSKNELSLNVFNLVAFGIIDASYERVIGENDTWGLEAFYQPNNNEDNAYYKDFSLTGKYKHFFSSTYARGFYVNGFGMLSNGDYPTGNYDYTMSGEYVRDTEKYTDFAIGFGLGGKFISPGGFMLDLNAGIGRNLFNDSHRSPRIVGQFMVNLGYRF